MVKVLKFLSAVFCWQLGCWLLAMDTTTTYASDFQATQTEYTTEALPGGHVTRPTSIVRLSLGRDGVSGATDETAEAERAGRAEEDALNTLRGTLVTPSSYVGSASGRAAFARRGVQPGEAVATVLGAEGGEGLLSRTVDLEDSRLGGSLQAFAATNDAWEASLAARPEVEEQIAELKKVSTAPLLKAGRPTMLSSYDLAFNVDPDMDARIALNMETRAAVSQNTRSSFVYAPPPPSLSSKTGGGGGGGGGKVGLSERTRNQILRAGLEEELGPQVADVLMASLPATSRSQPQAPHYG